jgi:hypothetical protein
VAISAVYNASDAAVSIGVDDAGLGQMWDNIPPKDVIKFGRGFYCGRLETESKDVRYVINGFYLSLRQSYCTVNKLCWFSVKIPQSLSWEQFRTHVVGSSEDPSACAKGSIRKTLSEKHPSKTTRGIEQNFLHVSESPLEALFERLNWIGSRTNLATDHFGAQLLEAGLTVETLEDWRADPDVFFEGSYQSVFNLHEGLDSSACIKRAVAVSASEQKALALLRRQAEI